MPGLADDWTRYQNAAAMADQLGMPRPLPPDGYTAGSTAPRAADRIPAGGRMPSLPKEARGARRRARKRRKSKSSVAENLWGKAIKGTAAAGEGIVPYGRVPERVRQAVSSEYRARGIDESPLVGWDPKNLEPEERAMLAQLLSMGEGFEGRLM